MTLNKSVKYRHPYYEGPQESYCRTFLLYSRKWRTQDIPKNDDAQEGFWSLFFYLGMVEPNLNVCWFVLLVFLRGQFTPHFAVKIWKEKPLGLGRSCNESLRGGTGFSETVSSQWDILSAYLSPDLHGDFRGRAKFPTHNRGMTPKGSKHALHSNMADSRERACALKTTRETSTSAYRGVPRYRGHFGKRWWGRIFSLFVLKELLNNRHSQIDVSRETVTCLSQRCSNR